ncbi:MAG: hypothetical protein ACYDA3_13195 [Gaiellaceae bacterium]
MKGRLQKTGAAVGALVALAIGGSALASAAQNKSSSTPPPVVQPATDGDNVQQGDQTGADAADAQSGAAEEQSGETASDGPGGYADTAANADTQQDGEH